MKFALLLAVMMILHCSIVQGRPNNSDSKQTSSKSGKTMGAQTNVREESGRNMDRGQDRHMQGDRKKNDGSRKQGMIDGRDISRKNDGKFGSSSETLLMFEGMLKQLVQGCKYVMHLKNEEESGSGSEHPEGFGDAQSTTERPEGFGNAGSTTEGPEGTGIAGTTSADLEQSGSGAGEETGRTKRQAVNDSTEGSLDGEEGNVVSGDGEMSEIEDKFKSFISGGTLSILSKICEKIAGFEDIGMSGRPSEVAGEREGEGGMESGSGK